MGKVHSYRTIEAVICPRSRVLTLNIDLCGVLVKETAYIPTALQLLGVSPNFSEGLTFLTQNLPVHKFPETIH